MKLKQTFFFFIFLLFPPIVYAQSLSLEKPHNTQLINKSTEKTDKTVITSYEYSSQLSKYQIVNFYRDLFSRRGLKEDNTGYSGNIEEDAFVFAGDYKEATMFFLTSYEEEAANYYSVVISQWSKTEVVPKKYGPNSYNPFVKVTDPQRVNFIPAYSGLKQVEYLEFKANQPPLISIGYLTHRDSIEVIDFYLNKMPSFGWALIKREPHQGMYSISQWLPMVAPYTSFCSSCEGRFPEEVPPLKIRGATLTFEKAGKKCVITVHTFEDIIEKAKSKSTIYDLTAMEKHGDTVIGVAYFY